MNTINSFGCENGESVQEKIESWFREMHINKRTLTPIDVLSTGCLELPRSFPFNWPYIELNTLEAVSYNDKVSSIFDVLVDIIGTEGFFDAVIEFNNERVEAVVVFGFVYKVNKFVLITSAGELNMFEIDTIYYSRVHNYKYLCLNPIDAYTVDKIASLFTDANMEFEFPKTCKEIQKHFRIIAPNDRLLSAILKFTPEYIAYKQGITK